MKYVKTFVYLIYAGFLFLFLSASNTFANESQFHLYQVPERLLVAAGRPWQVAASPDGKSIYTGNRRVDLERYEFQPLVWKDSAAGYGGGLVSRDGKRIAYMNRESVRIIRIDGGGVTTFNSDLYEHSIWIKTGGQLIAWLPENKGLAIYTAKGVVFLSLEDGTSRLVLPLRSDEVWDDAWTGPSLSPDGRFLAFPTLNGLSIAAIDSGKRRLLKLGRRIEAPYWIEDDRLLYTKAASGTWDLYSVKMHNGRRISAPRLMARDVGRIAPLSFTEAGDFIYWVGGKNSHVYEMGIDWPEKKLRGKPKSLVNLSRDGMWSPDGKRLSFQTRKIIEGDLPNQYNFRPAVLDLKSGHIEIFGLPAAKIRGKSPVTGSSGGFYLPAKWSPDGRKLIYTILGHGEPGLYTVDTQTGEGRWMIRGKRGEYFGAYGWLADGKTILYGHSIRSKNKSTFEVRTLRPDTGVDKIIWSSPGRFRENGQRLSPDGKFLTLIEIHPPEGVPASEVRFWNGDYDLSLSVLDLARGNRRELVRQSKLPHPWPGAGRHWFFGDNDWIAKTGYIMISGWQRWWRDALWRDGPMQDYSSQESGFWAVSAKGGPLYSLGKFEVLTGAEGFGARRFSVHPSGDRVAFTGGGAFYDVYILRGLGKR